MTISLVLAARHPIALDGLQKLLSLEPDFTLLAQCGDGDAALAAVRRHRPHVLVLDLQMPLKHGLAVLRALRAEPLPSRVVALAAAHDAASAREAVRLGARASCSRTTPRACWCRASARSWRAGSGSTDR